MWLVRYCHFPPVFCSPYLLLSNFRVIRPSLKASAPSAQLRSFSQSPGTECFGKVYQTRPGLFNTRRYGMIGRNWAVAKAPFLSRKTLQSPTRSPS